MHVCSARTQPLAGNRCARGNKTLYKKVKSVDSWIVILLLLWNCHSASTTITTTVTVTATATVTVTITITIAITT